VHYKGDRPIFDAERIEQDIEEGIGPKVYLKSGGHLVIDQSEALTAIDVNTGGFVGGKSRNLEETILKTNLEAVREIARQLRFRNIGGLIILDLIDMEVAQNREKVYRALVDAMREDKSRVNMLKISELGLVEMTRKRTRENLMEQLCDPCPTCVGKGYVQSPVTVCQKIFRELPKGTRHLRGETIAVAVHPDVADLLMGEEQGTLRAIEASIGRRVELRAEPIMHPEQFELSSVGARVAATESAPEPAPPVEAEAAEPLETEDVASTDSAEPATNGETPAPAELEAPSTPEAEGVDTAGRTAVNDALSPEGEATEPVAGQGERLEP
jgi:ribonuclease G